MNEWVERNGKDHDRQAIDLMRAHVQGERRKAPTVARFICRWRELARVWADLLCDKLADSEDNTFRARILPPLPLAAGDYVDRLALRPDDWAGVLRGTDAGLGAADDEDGDGVGRGLARHLGQELDRALTPDSIAPNQPYGGVDVLPRTTGPIANAKSKFDRFAARAQDVLRSEKRECHRGAN